MAEERFKTTLMGGFDKDDVLNQVREMKDAAYAEKSKLIKEKKEQEKQVQELKKQQKPFIVLINSQMPYKDAALENSGRNSTEI